jgi:hypothetical protein
MKIVYTGLESSGKSLLLSRQAEKIRKRNKTWLKRRTKKKLEPNPRTMAFNQPMSDKFIDSIEKEGLKYKEFISFHEIEYDVETDFFIDELLKFFPARGTDPLPYHVMEWLTQGAKSGNQIYASSQDFSQVHKQFRLLTNYVFMVRKHIGSPRPIKSMPPIGAIWGICTRTNVKPDSFKGDNATMESSFIPIPFMIKTIDCNRYDTLYKVPQATLPDLKLRKQRIYAEDNKGQTIYEKFRFK